MSDNVNERPRPTEYDDYRRYLRMMVRHLTHIGDFSYRKFAVKAGLSAAYLKLVIEGQRHVSYASMRKMSKALEHSPEEAESFEALVLFTQAETDDERSAQFRRLRASMGKKSESLMEVAQYEAYALWYALPIKEMVMLSDFQEDPAWIAARLSPQITAPQAEKALELLQTLGVLVRDSSGKLTRSEPKLATPPSLNSLAVRRYHRHLLDLAEEAMDTLPRDQRNVTSVICRLNRKQYEDVCRLIDSFRSTIAETTESIAVADDQQEIYQLGLQLFPVTRKT